MIDEKERERESGGGGEEEGVVQRDTQNNIYSEAHKNERQTKNHKNICRIIKDEPSKLLFFFLIKPRIVT